MTNLDRVITILPGNMKIYVRKCSTTCFQMQVSDFDHLNYFLNNAVIVSYKQEKSYCIWSIHVYVFTFTGVDYVTLEQKMVQKSRENIS